MSDNTQQGGPNTGQGPATPEAEEKMGINIQLPDEKVQAQLQPRISVVGCGGAGGNAVSNMIQQSLSGVEFIVANTDAQALALAKTDRRIQLGVHTTQGLGAGARPEVGRRAAEETLEEITRELEGSHMAFIAAGMGGGTGTGAAPVIAAQAREMGILTVGVVTKPFQFEGIHRMRLAEQGIEELAEYVDTLIIIPNQNLFRIATEKTTFADAFRMADDVLCSGVRGVTDLIVQPGLINLDFADIQSVMREMGKAMMGTGEAEGEKRAEEAARKAISNPLLEDASMKGATGVLVNITGGQDMGLFEADEAMNIIRDEVETEDANIIFGSTFDDSMEGKMRVSVVATGINAATAYGDKPENILDMATHRGSIQVNKPKPATQPAPAAAQPKPTATATAAKPAFGSRPLGVSPKPTAQPTAPAMPVPPQVQPQPQPNVIVGQQGGAPMSSHPQPQTMGTTALKIEDEMEVVARHQAEEALAEVKPQPVPKPVEVERAQAPARPQPRVDADAYIPEAPVEPMSALSGSRREPELSFEMPPQPAPRPQAQPQPQPQARAPQPAPAQPQRPAQPMPQQAAAEPAKRPSLFERVGLKRAKPASEAAAPAADMDQVQATADTVKQTMMGAISEDDRSLKEILEERELQQHLPHQGHGSEEDDMDIPAFLRRQAN